MERLPEEYPSEGVSGHFQFGHQSKLVLGPPLMEGLPEEYPWEGVSGYEIPEQTPWSFRCK